MKLLVTGGRFWNDKPATWEFLDYIHQSVGITLLIHGNAKGADTLCKEWAEHNNIDILSFPVTKDDWNRLGRKAGVLRNQKMLDEGNPDVLVAFPGENGTADMKRRATKHKLEIWEWTP